MSYLVDTCVISECVKKSPDKQVIDWFNQQEETRLFLSVVTIAELKKGIYKIKISQPERAAKLQSWLSSIELQFSQRILPISADVLEHWAQISAHTEIQGVKMPVMDALIAATAGCYRLALVTRNIEDFNRSGVELINPFL